MSPRWLQKNKSASTDYIFKKGENYEKKKKFSYLIPYLFACALIISLFWDKAHASAAAPDSKNEEIFLQELESSADVATGSAIELKPENTLLGPGIKALAAGGHVHTDECYEGHRHTSECYVTAKQSITYARGLDGINIITGSDSTSGWYTDRNRVFVRCKNDNQTIAEASHHDTGYENYGYIDSIRITQYYYGTYGNGVYQKLAYTVQIPRNLTSSVPLPGYSYNQARHDADYSDFYVCTTENPEFYTAYTELNKVYFSNFPSGSLPESEIIKSLSKIGFNPDIACWYEAPIYNKPFVSYNAGDQILICKEIQDETPDCDRVLVSIEPVYPTQTVYVNNPINTSVVATYMDGHTATIQCNTVFDTSIIGSNRIAVLTYSGLIGNAKTSGTLSKNITINVIPNLASITVTPSATTVYNGTVPAFTVVANYADGTQKVLNSGQYSSSGWTGGYGQKTVNFSYTENTKTVNASVVITVKPNITGLLVSANNTSVLYGSNITFTTTATYEDGTTKTVTATPAIVYDKNSLGVQNITYSYTENAITKSGSIAVEVLDYPVSLSVTLSQNWIYQGQNISIQQGIATLASGSTAPASLSIPTYDNESLGIKSITFTYSLNGRDVSFTTNFEIKPDLYDITLNSEDFTIYKGQPLDINVIGNFNVGGDVEIDQGDYVISGFDNNVYDRAGKYYFLSYTNRGITINKRIFIKVMPNIKSMTVSVPPQTTEGVHIPFTLTVEYEDGVMKTITDTDLGGENDNGLSIINYDINFVGYQDITFQYSEGGKTLSQIVNIRVRALINVSIPLSMLLSIDPNSGQVITPDIIINNSSKEPVLIGVQSIVPIDSPFNDVLPSAHSDWLNLGIFQSRDIAIGLNCKNNWLTEYLTNPLFVEQVNGERDIGIIDQISSSTVELVTYHGNAFNEQKDFTYQIQWYVELID